MAYYHATFMNSHSIQAIERKTPERHRQGHKKQEGQEAGDYGEVRRFTKLPRQSILHACNSNVDLQLYCYLTS